MPNWASITVHLSGPADEIQRFRDTCIREIRDIDEEEIGFDFESLVPMPAAIHATLDDGSAKARQIAKEATGFEDWYNWRTQRWGTKWNASCYSELASGPDALAFSFSTAWSFPGPVFAALAEQFPFLSGRVLASEPCDGWGAFGFLVRGTFLGAIGDITHDLGFLTCTKDRSLAERNAITAALESLVGSENAASADALARVSREQVWNSISTHLPATMAQRLAFRFIVEQVIERYDDDALCFAEADDDFGALDKVIRTQETIAFLRADGRCFASIDRNLMYLVADHLELTLDGGETEEELDHDFRESVAYLLVNVKEDRLWDWAAHAAFRPEPKLNLADLSTLQTSFVQHASRLRRQTLAFLAGHEASLSIAD
jgi:hypothetical protein